MDSKEQGSSIDEKVDNFGVEYRRLVDASCSHDMQTELTEAEILHYYLDTAMAVVRNAVSFMPSENIGPFLRSVGQDISNYLGREDHLKFFGEDEVKRYLEKGRQVADQVKFVMQIKDSSFNGEGTLLSLVRHCEDTGAYGRSLAYGMGFSAEEAEEIFIAGIIHDFGKISVPDKIIAKPAALTEEERAKITPHPLYGAQLLRDLGLQRMADIVGAHHRYYDGSGYGLETTDPKDPRYAILCLADAFDVIANGRPYKKGLGPEGAMKIVQECSGTQFHPEVVNTAVKTGCLVDEYKRRAA